jgi:hypothetical protein
MSANELAALVTAGFFIAAILDHGALRRVDSSIADVDRDPAEMDDFG